jgi:RND family efflux transporter MFP subunit
MHLLEVHERYLGRFCKKFLVLGGCGCVFAVAMIARPTLAQKPSATAPPPHVIAEKVEEKDVPVLQTFVGTVTPTRTSVVGSTVEERVVDLLVQEGDYVEKGQVLAELRLTAGEIELAGAKSELALLQEQLKDLKVSQPQQIRQAEARMLAAKAQYEYTNSQFQRGRQLAATSAITKEQLEEMVSSTDSARSLVNERTSAFELAKSIAPVKEAQAQARIDAQNEVIRGLEDAVAEHTIVAPFSGYVTREHTEVGQWMAKGGSVVELVELEYVEIEVPVMETYISDLRRTNDSQAGTEILDVTVEAFPSMPFRGEIASIVPRADVQSRTFPVKVRVQNRRGEDGQHLLRPGMFARVTLPVRTVRTAVMIPKDALVLGERIRPTVWVVVPSSDGPGNAPDRVRRVSIDVAYDVSAGNQVQVTGPLGPDGSLPLKPGDWVLVEGNERVNPNPTATYNVTTRENSP